MKLRLLILLAAALAAAPAAGQTVKSLGYNTTNGFVTYSGSNSLTFTNALQFSTNARAATRTNLGGTTLGNSVFTATNTAAAQVAILGTNAEINTSGGLVGITLSTNETKLLNPISFPFLGGATAAATSRTNLELGATNNVTFSNITATGIVTANDSTATPATNASAAQGIQWPGLGGSQHAAIYGGYAGAAQIALAVGTSNSLSDVATFRATGMTVASNAVVGGTLAVSNTATFSTNVTVNGNISVGSLTTTTPSTWALDATQTAAATNGVLALPSNANVIRLTNNNAISSVTNGVLGAFYYLVNQTTNAVTISNVGGITVQGGTSLTLGANQAATLVATGATNASVAARGDLTDVALGGTANTAPSQTASSGSSLMTRDLSDNNYLGEFWHAWRMSAYNTTDIPVGVFKSAPCVLYTNGQSGFFVEAFLDPSKYAGKTLQVVAYCRVDTTNGGVVAGIGKAQWLTNIVGGGADPNFPLTIGGASHGSIGGSFTNFPIDASTNQYVVLSSPVGTVPTNAKMILVSFGFDRSSTNTTFTNGNLYMQGVQVIVDP